MRSENNVHNYGKILEVLKTDSNGTQTVEMEFNCDRCSGIGKMEHLKHIDNGICYKCNGSKVITKKVKIYTDEQWEKLETKRELKRQKELEIQASKEAEIKRLNEIKEAEQQSKIEHFKKANEEFYKTLRSYMEHTKMDSWTKDFIKSIQKFKNTNYIHNLSDKQKETLCEVVGKSMGRRNSKAYNEAAKNIGNEMDYNFKTEEEINKEIFGN